MRTWCWALVAGAACFATGCSGEIRRMGGAASPSEPSSDGRAMAVVASGDAGCDGEALGVVDVPFEYGEGDGGSNKARDAIRAQAAKLGADAVIDVRHVTNGPDEHLLGTAVRCRSLREARPFDVIGVIDVPEVEDGPDAAFARLRARAHEMNADLVVDVRLASDDAAHAHVRGTAIKYR